VTGLLIDNFAGGGGASFGLMEAFGRKVDIAINHDAKALAMHEANHPETLHLCEDVFEVDPFEVCAGRPIDAAWFSPDCTHFSRAKGGKPVKKRIRGLAWVVMRWASLPDWQRPRVIFVENVEEFQTWGPLTEEGYPDKAKAGDTFRLWVKRLERRGYVVDWRMHMACDFGAPTIRKRFFLIARCDGEPIRWPSPTHFNPKKPPAPKIRVRLQPWRTAAECIDWSVPCPSIFDRKKPLADNTLRRVARGTMRYVVNNPSPFIVPLTHHGDSRVHHLDEPMRTVTGAHRGELALIAPFASRVTQSSNQAPVSIAKPLPTITTARGGEIALVAPSLIQTSYGEREGQSPRVLDLHQPLGTVVAGGVKHSLVASFLAQFNNNPDGSVNAGHPIDRPISPVTTRGPHQALTAAHLISFKGSDRRDGPLDAPAPSITAGGWHVGAVAAFLLSYYGASEEAVGVDGPLHTVTTRDRFGLVLVKIGGVDYVIVDIGMRMLTPRELFLAQGFSPSYKIQTGWGPKKKPLTKSDQIRMVGNSVSPPVAIAIAKANAPLMSRMRTPGEKEVAIA
jgi:DNA (cytosine-5)-methyltransferase 1